MTPFAVDRDGPAEIHCHSMAALKKSLSAGKRTAAAATKTTAVKAAAGNSPAPRKSAKRTAASVATVPKRVKKA
ncbi:hypothetical protein [Cupriavidus sp.]|jgi:DNA end-binding protein Ku|uniref:hypothetical protein n=1 Tax=Cupriavidus sp. TaxID=1873897 RepID=UPI003D0CEE81